jgi:hypothetical protein
VEVARFGERLIVVNHRSEPVSLAAYHGTNPIFQIESAAGRLAGHSAVCLQLTNDCRMDETGVCLATADPQL